MRIARAGPQGDGPGGDDLPILQQVGELRDFVRGRRALRNYPEPVQQGIMLHRYIDKRTDSSKTVKKLRPKFPREFRRYAGIIIDLAFDHELALNWWRYMPGSLERFDQETRDLIRDNADMVPEGLHQFMRYADRHGLFAAYRDEDVTLYALAGLGTRLSRANPLHRVAEIWPDLVPEFRSSFREFYPQIQSDVLEWRKLKSTTTGS